MARPFYIALVQIIVFAMHLSLLLGGVFAEVYGDDGFPGLLSGGR